jgi:hypothetical protein
MIEMELELVKDLTVVTTEVVGATCVTGGLFDLLADEIMFMIVFHLDPPSLKAFARSHLRGKHFAHFDPFWCYWFIREYCSEEPVNITALGM